LIGEERHGLDTGAILMALGQEPFASVRRMASKTLIPKTIVYRNLVGNDTEASPLGSSQTFIAIEVHPNPKGSGTPRRPQVSKQNSGKNIIVLGGSFFSLETDYEQMSVPEMKHPKLESIIYQF
jgi:hypothetical protein